MEYNTYKKHNQYKSTCNMAKSYFKEYCDYTGIHGFRYIAEERTWTERIWWILALVLSMIFSGLMIYQILQKYLHYPVIVTFSMQEVLLNEIPFPAVTICPRSKISQDYFNITDAIIKKMNNDSFRGETERLYNMASAVCDFYPTEESNNDTTFDDVYNFLNMSQTDIFHYCSYIGQQMNCHTFFKRILTDEGLCYSFNIMDKMEIFRENIFTFPGYHEALEQSNWDSENGYVGLKHRMQEYPFRAYRPGAKNGFLLVLKTKNSDIEFDCSSDESGYRVVLHLPSKVPEVTESYITVPLNQRVTGQIIPHMIKTSVGVKTFDPIKRDCYFQSERSLEYFKIYTQDNCIVECKTKFVLNACGCVGYYMPRYNDTDVCILDDILCMETAEENFTLFSIMSAMPEYEEKIDNVSCNCLPTCTDLTYGLEISQNSFVYKPRDVFNQLDEGYQYSILNLYFKRNHIETKERNEIYGFSDFISNFGGLLGLFTGFSMLSFIEIIYFLSLRIWGNIKMYKNWSGNFK